MGRVLDLDFENISPIVNSEGITVIDFWAEWCGPCKSFSPIYDKLAEEFPNVRFTKLNVDQQEEIANEANVQSIPTIMAFKNGTLIYRSNGSMQEPQLRSLIQEAIDLDLDNPPKKE